MRFEEITEYQIVPDPEFTNFDLSGGSRIGQINTPAGLFQVWKLETDDEVIYGAVLEKTGQYGKKSNPGPKKPIAIIGFEKGFNSLMAKNAWTMPKYQSKGISSTLMMFAAKISNQHIFSDTRLTLQGEKLWFSLMNSGRFDVNIFYIPTNQVFDIDAPEKNIKASSDGTTVISPKNDNKNGYLHSENNPNGQKFLYVIKVKENIIIESQGKVFKFGMNIEDHSKKLLQPYSYFFKGDEWD